MRNISNFISIIFLLFSQSLFSQESETKQIKIIQADEGSSHPTYQNTHVLSGNVIFEHDSTLMHCDSAYFFLDSNVFHAFSNIKVLRGDSIKLYGDTLFYHGMSKTADLMGNVKYNDNKFQLITESLHYDFNTEIGSYNKPAVITNRQDKNTLKSKKGDYHSSSKIVYFKDSVHLHNESYDMFSDTLVYNTSNKTAFFYGPTEILSKKDKIICNKGYYDTEKEITSLWNRASLINPEQSIEGDSIHYNRTTGIGEIFGNVIMNDTVNKVQLFGDSGFHNEETDSTAVFGEAQMTQLNEKDTLFLTANYLTIKTDSSNTNKIIRAYDAVRIHQSDFQGICDSLVYSDLDSLMKFYHEPILWSDKNQITGDYIQALIVNKEISGLEINKNAMVISEVDTSMYDQIKGKDIYAKFKDQKIIQIDVKGNGKTLYHIQNEDSLYLEANSAECADIVIYFKKEEIDQIKFLESPKAVYQSIAEMTRSQKYFEGFIWEDKKRPAISEFVPPIE